MICPYCGEEISDLAVVCPKCGVSIERVPNPTGSDGEQKANGGFIALSFFFPIVGIILGIIDISKGNKKAGKTYIITAIISWAVWFLLGCCIGIVPFLIGLGGAASAGTSSYSYSYSYNYAIMPLLFN